MAGNLVEILIVGKNMSKAAFAEARADGSTLGGVMKAAGAVAVTALVAMGVEAVKMAANYQTLTTRLVTSAGEQKSNLKMVQDGMLSMAGQVGVSATDLAKAMYYVEAAGYHGADGLTVLKAAAQGAAAEGADTTDVAKALTDVLVDYHMKASQAATVTSQMITAVAHGKVNLEDFSKAFASIVPAASAAGIGFNDVGAALSEMTNHGFTAQRASQNLAQALRSMLNPTAPMVKAFDSLGGSAQVLHDKLNSPNGLTNAMEYASQIAERAGKIGTPAYAAALKNLMGTAAGANAALATTGENAYDTNATIEAMSKSTKDAQGNVQGFATVNQTLGQRFKELDAGFQSVLISLGQKLIPILTQFVDYVANNAGPVMKVLGDYFRQTLVPIFQQFWQVLSNLWTVAQPIIQDFATVALGAFVAIGDVLKTTVMPLLVAVTGFLAQHKTVVEGVVAGYVAYKTALTAISGAVKLVELATKAWEAAQALLNIVLDANPIGLAIIAIAALAAGIYEAYKHSEAFREAVAITWPMMETTVGTSAHYILVAIQGISTAILGVISIQVNMLAKAFGWVPGIGPLLKDAANSFNSFANSVQGSLQKAIDVTDQFTQSATIAAREHILQVQINGWMDNLNAAKKQLLSVPASKKASIEADIATLSTNIAVAKQEIAGLQGKTVTIVYNGVTEGVTGPGGSYTSTTGFGYASGGVVSNAAVGGGRSGLTLVGERGPELVRLPGGSYVTPAGQTRAMLSGGAAGGGGPAVIEFVSDDAWLLQIIRQMVRVRGGNVQVVFGRSY